MEECANAAAGFKSVSSCGAIENCIGVIDRYLAQINAPTQSMVGNVCAYFSVHYKCYSINIQAITDHLPRFIYFALAAPGSIPNRDAIQDPNLSIFEMIHELPEGYVVIGDAAYPVTKKKQMYFGPNRLHTKYNN